VVLGAVSQNGLALKDCSAGMRNDKDIVLAAVQNCGSAIEFASEAQRDDADVVIAACKCRNSAKCPSLFFMYEKG
jgi:hypothetical protein